MNPDRYYRPSGTAPVVGLLITLAIGMIGGIVLSIIYSGVVYYNPYAYLNILAGMGFAVACGALSKLGVTIGKVRNRVFAGLAGATVGFIAMFFAWVTLVYFLVDDGFGNGLLTFDVSELFHWIKRIGEDGWWAFNEGAGNFNGWGLYGLWIAEALIVIGASAVIAYSKDTPFCEACNQWCDEQDCPTRFPMVQDVEAMRSSLEADDLSPLYQSAQLSPDADVFLKAKLYPCPKCDDTSWLKVVQVVASLDKNGQVQTKETTLINYLDIAREDCDRMINLVPGTDTMWEDQELQSEPEVPPVDEQEL